MRGDLILGTALWHQFDLPLSLLSRNASPLLTVVPGKPPNAEHAGKTE